MSRATRSRVQMCQLTGEFTVPLSPPHHPHPVSLTHTAMKSCEMLSCHLSKHSLQADLDKLFTHGCSLISTWTTIVQFTHDIITGLISYKAEADYRVDHVAEQSKDSDLAFNSTKNKRDALPDEQRGAVHCC